MITLLEAEEGTGQIGALQLLPANQQSARAVESSVQTLDAPAARLLARIGGVGATFSAGSVSSLHARLLLLLQNNSLAEMGETARAHISRWDVHAPRKE